MEKKIIIINAIILLLIVSGLIYIIIGNVNKTTNTQQNCLEINEIINAQYTSCYDENSQNIILNMKRYKDTAKINRINAFFTDAFGEKRNHYPLIQIPLNDKEKRYKIPSLTNPKEMTLDFDLENTAGLCDNFEIQILEIEQCSQAQLSGPTIDLILSEQTDIISQEEQNKKQEKQQESDTIPIEFAEKQSLFDLTCQSNWKCFAWEECINGIEGRDCIDENSCYFSTNVPEFTRSCDGNCQENWGCQWSVCTNGFTTPTCVDKNNCQTTFSKPKKISCTHQSQKDISCIPKIECESWSGCNPDYGFIALLSEDVGEIKGIKSRICRDTSKCIDSIHETDKCSVRVDIYTEVIEENGQKTMRIYNKINNQLITEISKSDDSEGLNINLIE